MDIGKTKLLIQPYFSGDQLRALEDLSLAMQTLNLDHLLTPGFASIATSVAIAVGQAVNINGGLLRLADAATVKPAIGICVKAATTAGQKAGIILGVGYAGGLAGITINSPVYVGNAGALVYAIPGAGMKQSLGFSLSATEIFVTISQPFA